MRSTNFDMRISRLWNGSLIMKHRYCLFVFVLLFGLPSPVAAVDPPLLIVEGAPALSPIATRMKQFDTTRVQTIMNLIGVDYPGNPIRVIVAPEESDWALRTPSWVSGYAISQQDLIVILPERVIGYPYDSLESLLAHELAHILIGRAAGGQPVPRWFDEGLAMVAAHTWEFEDQARLVWAMVMGRPTTLTELEQLFHQNRASAQKAYVLAHTLIRYCIQRFGDDWPKQLLASLAQKLSFQEAFFRTTSQSFKQVQTDFWADQNLWAQWIPVVTSSAVLWMGILGLALYVFKKQRQRAESVKRQWKDERDWDI